MKDKKVYFRCLALLLGAITVLSVPISSYHATENWTVQDGFSKPSCLGANDNLVIQSSKQEILEALQSSETFSVEGTIDLGYGRTNINDYYDFSTLSKFEIADWAYENKLISEEEKIDSYCELIDQNNFNNIKCLNGVIEEIIQYRDTHTISVEFTDKIEKVLGSASPNYVPPIQGQPVYESTHFRIYYDKDIGSNAARDVADYMEALSTYFSNLGFRAPLYRTNIHKHEVYLKKNNNDNIAGTTVKDEINGNVCASHIIIYGFQSVNVNKESIAHEYFHSIQMAYNHQVNWFQEACASMAACVYHNNLDFTTIMQDVNTFISNIDKSSMLYLDKEYGYGALLFPVTIYQEYGGWSTIKKIYEAYNGVSASITMSKLRDVIDTGMENNGYSNGFAEAYRTLATYVLNRNFFKKSITSYTFFSNKKDQTMNSFSVPTEGGYFSASIPGTTSKYYRITFPSGYSGSAHVRLINYDSSALTYMQLYTEDNTGYHAEMVDVSTTLYVDPDVTEIILVISNTASSTNSGSVVVAIYPN